MYYDVSVWNAYPFYRIHGLGRKNRSQSVASIRRLHAVFEVFLFFPNFPMLFWVFCWSYLSQQHFVLQHQIRLRNISSPQRTSHLEHILASESWTGQATLFAGPTEIVLMASIRPHDYPLAKKESIFTTRTRGRRRFRSGLGIRPVSKVRITKFTPASHPLV